MQPQLDQDVVNLSKAIRQSESGGNFNAKGKSGEYGGYQYTPDTWNSVAPKYGINVPIEKATPEQQNAVTYNRIKAWKDKGHDVTEIASMWNAGEGEPKAYTGKFSDGSPSKGKNKMNVDFDVPKYVASVASAYQQLKGGIQPQIDPNNPSSVEKQPGAFQSAVQGLASIPLKVVSSIRQIGNAGNQEAYDKVQNEGYDYGYFGKQRPLGQIEGGIHSVSDFGKAVLDPVKAGAEVGTALVGAGLLSKGSGLLSKMLGERAAVKIISNPVVSKALEGSVGGSKVVAEMTPKEIYNGLQGILRTAGKELTSTDATLITNAVKKIEPYALREAGLKPGLIQSGLTGAGKLAWKGTKAVAKTLPYAAGYGILQGAEDVAKSLIGKK